VKKFAINAELFYCVTLSQTSNGCNIFLHTITSQIFCVLFTSPQPLGGPVATFTS